MYVESHENSTKKLVGLLRMSLNVVPNNALICRWYKWKLLMIRGPIYIHCQQKSQSNGNFLPGNVGDFYGMYIVIVCNSSNHESNITVRWVKKIVDGTMLNWNLMTHR